MAGETGTVAMTRATRVMTVMAMVAILRTAKNVTMMIAAEVKAMVVVAATAVWTQTAKKTTTAAEVEAMMAMAATVAWTQIAKTKVMTWHHPAAGA